MLTVAIVGGIVAVVLLFHELARIRDILCQIRDEAYFERTAQLLAAVDENGKKKAPQVTRTKR